MEKQLDIQGIQAIIPHRYPFLLLDRVIEIEPLKRLVAIKNVTVNEPFFQGHFPGAPVMPGVLIIEAMAQAGAVLLLREVPDRDNKLLFFTSIYEAKFRHPVVPGDTLRVEVEVIRFKPRFCKLQCRALVDGKLAAEATLSSALADKSVAGGAEPSSSQPPEDQA